MVTKVNVLLVASAGLMLCASAGASTVELGYDQFAVLSGGTFSMSSGATINGLVGSVDNVSLGTSATVHGDLYTSGSFTSAHKAQVDGLLIAGGDVSLGRQTTFSTVKGWGNVSLDQQATVNGDLMSGMGMTIGKLAVVHGNVDYGTSYWADSKAKIDGSRTQTTSELDIWSPALRTVSDAWVSGFDDLSFGAMSDQTLSPGTYGNLNAANDSVIHLSAGVYNFSSFSLGQSNHLVADTSQGNVIINVAGDVNTGSSTVFDRNSTGWLIFNARGNIALGQNNTVEAAFLGYGISLDIGDNSSVTGYLYSAGNLSVGSSVVIEGSSAAAIAANQPIPEPMTLAFLSCAPLLLYFRKQPIIQ